MAARLQVAEDLARGRPVIVGESGLSTGFDRRVGSEESQKVFYQKAAQLVSDHGLIAFAPWILQDFSNYAMPAFLRSRTEASYGLRRLDGSWKPAAFVVRDMFAGNGTFSYSASELASTKIDYDGGFERENLLPSTTGVLGAWQTFNASAAGIIGVRAGVGAFGSAAAILGHTGGNAQKVPAIRQSFLLLQGKRTVSVHAQVRLFASTGTTRVSIAWFSGTSYLSGTDSSAADNTLAGAQIMSASGTAPEAANAFQIHLKSANNSGIAYFDNVVIS
jgi:hypothetical protein